MPYFLKDFVTDVDDTALRFELETLIAASLGIERIDIYLEKEPSLSDTDYCHLKKLVSRRLSGEPLQYILGYAHFRELKLEVGRGVLIPRPETENIINLAKKYIIDESQVIDIGTGSGAIALSIAKEFPRSHVLGVDISETALNYAIKNRDSHKIHNAEFIINDLASGFAPDSFDIILANLPYIPYSNYQKLEKDVREFEPELALSPGRSGLELIEKLIRQAATVLRKGGVIILEMDKDQGIEICDLFALEKVFVKAEIHWDYNNLNRFVISSRFK